MTKYLSVNKICFLGLQLHEPDPLLRGQHQLSFEGFARYLMDADNSAIATSRQWRRRSRYE